jgi:hypothetical protein
MLQSATFFGGADDQRGSAIAINGSDLYVAGYTQSPTVDGLLVKYGLPPGPPVWSAIHTGANFNGLALTASTAYPVGQAAPPVCGASDGVGDTERKSLLDRYSGSGALIGCGSLNFFPYRGIEYYLTARAVNESSSDFVYAAGQAEQLGFSFSFPFVVVKYDSVGNVVMQATEPGVTLGSFSGCCPGDSNAYGLAELNGYIYIAGNSRLPGVGEDGAERPVLMKYDTTLNRIWKARPTDHTGFFRAVTASGGNIYAVGHARFDSSADYLIEKYDELGNRIWSVTSGGGSEDVLTGIIGIGSRLFAVGYTRSDGAGGADAVILEIDPATGSTVSTTLYGGAQDDFANGAATDGTDLYVVGESRSFASGEGNAVGQNDGMLLRYSFNQPPVAACHDVTVSAGLDCAANASIDNGSLDPDSGDTITLAQSPSGPYPLGTTSVTLTVTDNHGASSQCTAAVTVVDDTPPVIAGVSASPSSLWPANHKMVDVTVNYTATDNCGAQTCALSVSGNEPVNGTGDGDMAPDWEIIDAHHVRLRAERAGTGSGRVYTITITCTDSHGNSSTATVKVSVPKNEK